jgi:hypothetical protein
MSINVVKVSNSFIVEEKTEVVKGVRVMECITLKDEWPTKDGECKDKCGMVAIAKGL